MARPAVLWLLSLSALTCIVNGFETFKGVSVTRVSDSQTIDFASALAVGVANKALDKTLVVLGTYAADFNQIEYAQKLRYYFPKLKEKGIDRFVMVINAGEPAIKALSKLVDLPAEVELYSDPQGVVGRRFNVNRGFRPDDEELNPYAKLFAMLFGAGAWMTLPSVISGYIGNPWGSNEWIESALLQGQMSGRWPNNVLEVDSIVNGTIASPAIKNKFAELPYVGGWKRRPLELATLRLQNMIGISLQNWDILKPTEEELKHGVLTQLGACFVLKGDSKVYEFRDEGICHVANFDQILKVL